MCVRLYETRACGEVLRCVLCGIDDMYYDVSRDVFCGMDDDSMRSYRVSALCFHNDLLLLECRHYKRTRSRCVRPNALSSGSFCITRAFMISRAIDI